MVTGRQESQPRRRWRGKRERLRDKAAGHPIFAIELLICIDPKICCAPERSAIPSGAGASGSNDLPWALPRVLQAIPKIKRAAGENGPARRPRPRLCLLKGCEQRFRPRRARQRYCSEPCRKAARAWSRWKAQQSYRATAAGKQKRNGQSRRYRERVRSRKPPAGEAVPERREGNH